MPYRKYLSQWVKDIMTAEAFEDGGKFENTQKIRKKVLLVITGDELDAKSIKYAVNLCNRVKAGLDILCITTDDGDVTLLEKHLKKLKTKVNGYHIVKMEKSLRDEVIHYTEQLHGIDFVVINSRDINESTSLEERYVKEEWKELRCPLVMVS